MPCKEFKQGRNLVDTVAGCLVDSAAGQLTQLQVAGQLICSRQPSSIEPYENQQNGI